MCVLLLILSFLYYGTFRLVPVFATLNNTTIIYLYNICVSLVVFLESQLNYLCEEVLKNLPLILICSVKGSENISETYLYMRKLMCSDFQAPVPCGPRIKNNLFFQSISHLIVSLWKHGNRKWEVVAVHTMKGKERIGCLNLDRYNRCSLDRISWVHSGYQRQTDNILIYYVLKKYFQASHACHD